MAFLPYILHLLLEKDKLNKKHYFFLFLIGLNSSLIQDIFAFIFLIPLAILLKNRIENLTIYLKVFSLILFSSILSNIHLVIGSIVSSTIHRESWNMGNVATSPFLEVIKEFFLKTNFEDPLFIFYLPLAFLSALILILPSFSKQKKIIILIFFIIFILILKSILHHNFIDHILVGAFDVFKGFNFQRVDRIIPLAYTLLLILYIGILKKKVFKNFLYFISFLAIICIQLKVPLPELGKYFLNKNMHAEKFVKVKKDFSEKKYAQVFKIIIDKKNYTKNERNFDDSIIKTFNNYYKFKDYAFIRNIVKNSRVMSVGLDPMVAVMNDIKVVDGYHNIYPLSYKIKFRKVIEAELEKNIMLKNYYDSWGSRVYAFYTNENNIELNFQSAKDLGADYVISKFPIENDELKTICFKCNNSNHIFLYKII
jgi:hypothetical protein